jgi:DNA-binding LacI/PurR family transcriptional regulator
MTELGLAVPGVYIVEGDHKMEGGKAAMERLIALAELPTAVICSNDMTAIGVLHALDETTLKVPADISVGIRRHPPGSVHVASVDHSADVVQGTCHCRCAGVARRH